VVKLILEFHPVQPEHVQEAFHHVHQHQYADRNGREHGEGQGDIENIIGSHGRPHDLIVKHFGKLAVRETQGPETEVRGRVRDRAEDEFDGFNELVDHHFSEIESIRLPVHVFRVPQHPEEKLFVFANFSPVPVLFLLNFNVF